MQCDLNYFSAVKLFDHQNKTVKLLLHSPSIHNGYWVRVNSPSQA